MYKYIKIYLVRHGETTWNTKGIRQGQSQNRLNENGKKQAKKMARFFKNIHLDNIYCSPLKRTMQTVQAVLKYHSSSKLVKWPEFMQRNAGILQGKNLKQILKIIPDIKKQWKKKGVDWHPPKGGETLRELYIRSNKGFYKMIKNHKPGDTILVVTHRGIIKCLTILFNKRKAEDYLKIEETKNCEIMEILWNNGPKKINCILK